MKWIPVLACAPLVLGGVLAGAGERAQSAAEPPASLARRAVFVDLDAEPGCGMRVVGALHLGGVLLVPDGMAGFEAGQPVRPVGHSIVLTSIEGNRFVASAAAFGLVTGDEEALVQAELTARGADPDAETPLDLVVRVDVRCEVPGGWLTVDSEEDVVVEIRTEERAPRRFEGGVPAVPRQR